MSACIALARHVDYHAFGHSCRYIDFNNLFAFYNSAAATHTALVLYYRAFSAASGAYTLCLHHAEEALRCVGYNSAAVACRASLLCAVAFRTATMAMTTRNILLNLELLGYSCGYFLQREPYFQAQVGTTVLCRTALASATETAATEAAKPSASAKHVAEHGEYVVHREASGTAEAAKPTFAARAVEAKLVVLFPLLWVMQYVVSLGCLLEFILGLFVAWIPVRVVFYGDFPVSLLYFVF